MKQLTIFLLLLVLGSCQAVQDVPQVGSGYLDKSILDGEWYYAATVVDKQFPSAAVFIGAECNADRIRFELTEKNLFAYRSYEKTPGTETGKPGTQNLIVAFKVLKHFDIKREYNSLTGVENNVIIENDFDQPWHKRQYVRIDWSKNLAPDGSCSDWLQAESFTQIQHETHPREPYRTRVSKDYIETTQEALIKPSKGACREIGEWNCTATSAKVKLSFAKVKESNYELRLYPDSMPLEYGKKGKDLCVRGEEGCGDLKILRTYSGPDGKELCDPRIHNIEECEEYKIPIFSRFGYFRTERYHYDREHGFTLTGRQQLINRWNLEKPIVFYLNPQFPEDLYQAAQEIAQDWSSAFEAVAKKKNLFQIKRNSCNVDHVLEYARQHGFEADLHKNGIGRVERGNLEQACAVLEWASHEKKIDPVFHWEQLGDVRYSILNYTVKAELAGPLGYGPSFTDPLTGEIIQAAANIYGASIDTYAARGADIVQAMNNETSVERLAQDDPKATPTKVVNRFASLVRSRAERLGDNNYFVPIGDATPSNWDRLRDLRIEERYLLEDFKPSLWEEKLSNFERKQRFWEERNACFAAEFIDPQVTDLAASLKGKSWMEAYQIIRAQIFKATAAHELGHNLGLRHNFEGSIDAMNFSKSFWEPETKHKAEMQYSSIMDYGQRFNSDFFGIGLYDRAAIKFGYGNLVEVFDESEEKFVPNSWHNNKKLFHYTDLPYLYAGGGVNEKLTAHYKKVKSAYDAGKSARVDIKSLGIEAKPNNLYKRKDVSFDDYYISVGRNLFGKKGYENLHEVPYLYCSDTYASGSSLTCNRWDMGASQEEVVQNAADLYENYYWLNSFRRDRIKISVDDYGYRLYTRTYRPMLNPFRYLYYYQKTSLNIWPMVQDWSAAAYKGLNFFGRVLQSVEPGRYCLGADKLYVPEQEVSTCESPVEIGLDQGRYYDTHFTPEYFYKANNIGHMYDKLYAMRALTDSRARFVRDFSDQFNRGAFSIGYYRIFAPEMIRLFTNLMLDKAYENAPLLVVDSEGKAKVQYRPIVSFEPSQAAAEQPRIKSSSSWAMRHYALLFPAVNFTSPVDGQMDYIKRARITLVGSGQDPVHGGNMKEATLEDPYSHLRYRSYLIGSEDLSPGYMILNDTKEFARTASNSEEGQKSLRERLMLIDLLRTLGDYLDSAK
ncbi:MAG: zinc-dependent metalloprotease [Deltaproteobacteria bacterium]|nr:zinc-dependent metalloprotease [Deltaproteobacteria bacterium]